MTWFMDADNWRDESTEGPYDTLATWMGDDRGDYQIFRGLYQKRFEVIFKGVRLQRRFGTEAEAKAFVKEHYTAQQQKVKKC